MRDTSPRFVVYSTRSTAERKRFYYRHAADRLAEKLNGYHGLGSYAVASLEDYATKIVHMVTRRNLLSGQEYQEPSNTPGYCSPASEAYWSK